MRDAILLLEYKNSLTIYRLLDLIILSSEQTFFLLCACLFYLLGSVSFLGFWASFFVQNFIHLKTMQQLWKNKVMTISC